MPVTIYPLPSSVRLPCTLPEFTYPEGPLQRRINIAATSAGTKNRIFISEVFRFEELGFE